MILLKTSLNFFNKIYFFLDFLSFSWWFSVFLLIFSWIFTDFYDFNPFLNWRSGVILVNAVKMRTGWAVIAQWVVANAACNQKMHFKVILKNVMIFNDVNDMIWYFYIIKISFNCNNFFTETFGIIFICNLEFFFKLNLSF